ncbi:MAG: hypothetical protein QOH79_3008 [Acidimicrobiaceae bacterium]
MTYEPQGPPPPQQPPWQPPPAGAPYPASAYGTPGYGYAPVAEPVKSLKGLSTAVVVLLAVTGLAALWAAFALFHRASVVNDFTGFGGVSFQDLEDADSQVSGSVGLLQFGILATAVLWMIWQFRFAKNAQALRGNYGLAPGWAIGGWFIPLGNLVLPQLQLFQAAKASDPDLPAGQAAASGRAPATVPAWWVAYDLAAVLFAIGAVMRPNKSDFDFDLDRYVRADRVSALSCLVYAVAAVIAIVMVRALSDRQMRAAASAAPSQQGYQQPYQQGYQQPYPPQQPPQQPWQPPPAAPPPQAPPQTWAPPPPNQPWQPPPPQAPPPS